MNIRIVRKSEFAIERKKFTHCINIVIVGISLVLVQKKCD